ncbi:MAG: hypothetical protein AB8H79_16940 [Myxococcota bacterium]
MKTRWLALAVIMACNGDSTDESDTDPVDTSCRFVLPVSTFTFSEVPSGQTATGDFILEAQCPDAIQVQLEWQEPHSGVFQVEGAMTLTLEPRVPTAVQITFTPPRAGDFADSMVITPDSSAGSGVITTFRGTGT